MRTDLANTEAIEFGLSQILQRLDHGRYRRSDARRRQQSRSVVSRTSCCATTIEGGADSPEPLERIVAEALERAGRWPYRLRVGRRVVFHIAAGPTIGLPWVSNPLAIEVKRLAEEECQLRSLVEDVHS